MSERFLVVKLADLGDVLTITPALRAIREAYPRARIDALVTALGATALDGLDSVDRLIPFDKAQFDRVNPKIDPLVEVMRLGLHLRQQAYDRVFLFHHLFTSTGRAKYGALLTATAAPWRAGLAEQCPWFLTDVAEDLGYGVRHEADYWLDVAILAGARRPSSPRLEIAVDELARRQAARLVGDRPTGRTIRVALSPGSGKYSPGRRWSASSYVAVGRRLVEDYRPEIDLIVVGTADERELANTICAGIGPVARNIAGQTDLKTLAAILATCDTLISNDGGAIHVAAAAGIPVLAVFGPSDHVSWGPFGAKTWEPGHVLGSGSLVVRHDLPCAPCLYRGFLPGTPKGCRSHDCLRLVTPGDIVQAAHHLLPPHRKG